MKFLIIISGLFLFGCSNGGFVLSSERETQDILDMDLLAAEDLESSDQALLADVGSAEEPSDFSPTPAAVNSDSPKPKNREFGKRRQRRQKDYDLAVNLDETLKPDEIAQSDSPEPTTREFGKRRKESTSDSDLVVEPEEVSKPEVDQVVAVEVEDINNKVDILFVVDGSFSTRDILRSIPERMDGFIPALDTSLDWRVGFIGADVKRNKNKKLSSMEIDGAIILERKYITNRTRSKERIFIDTLTRNKTRKRCEFPPQCGSRKETPLLALNEYILSPTRSVENGTRFIRNSAHLAVVIVTDNKENKKRGQITTSDEVLAVVEQEFGRDKEFSVHTLTVMNDACRGQLQEEHFFVEGNRAREILLLTRETGGANLSLCSYDYAVPLATAIEKSVLGEEVDCSACASPTVISDQERAV